jgi:hypothetical protein
LCVRKAECMASLIPYRPNRKHVQEAQENGHVVFVTEVSRPDVQGSKAFLRHSYKLTLPSQQPRSQIRNNAKDKSAWTCCAAGSYNTPCIAEHAQYRNLPNQSSSSSASSTIPTTPPLPLISPNSLPSRLNRDPNALRAPGLDATSHTCNVAFEPAAASVSGASASGAQRAVKTLPWVSAVRGEHCRSAGAHAVPLSLSRPRPRPASANALAMTRILLPPRRISELNLSNVPLRILACRARSRRTRCTPFASARARARTPRPNHSHSFHSPRPDPYSSPD